ncbi:MAG: hypothetical protein OYH77_01595 [Pseudomonadota bacterium]|nr:hypothetical protein [Pseudomonadota bacterium]
MMFVSRDGDTPATIISLKNKNTLTPLNLQDELAHHLKGKPNDGSGLFIAQYSPTQYGLHKVTVANGEIKLGTSDLFEVNIPERGEDATAEAVKLLDVLVPNKERLKLEESGEFADVAYERLFSFFAQGLHRDEVVALNTDEITEFAFEALGIFPREVSMAFEKAVAGVDRGNVSNEVSEAARLFKDNFPKNGSPTPEQANEVRKKAIARAPKPEAPVEAKPAENQAPIAKADAKPESQIPDANQIAETADEARHVEAEQMATPHELIGAAEEARVKFATHFGSIINKSKFDRRASLAKDTGLTPTTVG